MDVEDHDLRESGAYRASNNNSSVGHLIMEITEDLSTLVRKEVELAKNEITEIVRTKVIAAAMLLVAVVMGVLVLPFAMLSIVEILALWLPRWAATSIVTGAVIAIALISVVVARQFLKSKLIPKDTIDAIKKDVKMAKDSIRHER